MDTIEQILKANIYVERRNAVLQFHEEHKELFMTAKGSKEKHQAWEGGYNDHLNQCFTIADVLYKNIFDYPFHYDSVVIVLYFHDIEKMWKYTTGLPDDFDKWKFYTETLPEKHNINFTNEELNALKYIHGEGNDYSDKRVMNELAAFCHACDTLSARCFYNLKNIGFNSKFSFMPS